MVAEDGAAEDSTGHELDINTHVYRHRQADDGHYRHRAHGGAGREGQEHAQQEAQHRQQCRGEHTHEHGGEVVAGVKALDEVAHREAEEQHRRHRQHSAHALEHLVYDALDGVLLLRDAEDADRQHGEDAAPQQALHTGALSRVAVAGDGEGGKDGHDKHAHRQDHVDDSGLCVADLVGSIAERSAVTRLVKLAGLLGALLGLAHRADVYIEEAHRKRAEHGKDAVEVQRDGLEQHGYRLALGNAAGGEIAGHRGKPAAEREEHAPRSRGRVDYERGLLMRHLERVIERAGDGAGHHAAERTGGEDDDAEQPREQVRAALGLDERALFEHDLSKTVDAAGLFNEVNERADQQEGREHDGVAVALKGVDEAVKGLV